MSNKCDYLPIDANNIKCTHCGIVINAWNGAAKCGLETPEEKTKKLYEEYSALAKRLRSYNSADPLTTLPDADYAAAADLIDGLLGNVKP